MTAAAAKPKRSIAIDALRGVVMIAMVVDHARDFFFGMGVKPTDVAHSWPSLFFTRWLTHFCAPGFVLLAGVAMFLSMQRKETDEARRAQRMFLLKRGLFLVVLEVTVVRLGWVPDPTYRFTLLQVIWAIGWSMVLLAPLTALRVEAIAAIGLIVVFGHNLLDTIQPASFGSFDWLWILLHGRAHLEPLPGRHVMVSYAVLPWFGVMASGYALGALFANPKGRARRMVMLGTGLVMLFVVVRSFNGYGNNTPWLASFSGTRQLMSFLNAQKYPPSLAFTAMTVGPLLLLLALFERQAGVADPPGWMQRLAVYGRAPLFFYLAHLFLLRFTSLIAAYLRFGMAGFEPPPGHAGNPDWPLWVTWLISGATVLLLFPACRWFIAYKRRAGHAWLRYV